MMSLCSDPMAYRQDDGFYSVDLIEDVLQYGAIYHEASCWLASEGARQPVVYRKCWRKDPKTNHRIYYLVRAEGWQSIGELMDQTKTLRSVFTTLRQAWDEHWDFVDHIKVGRVGDGERGEDMRA